MCRNHTVEYTAIDCHTSDEESTLYVKGKDMRNWVGIARIRVNCEAKGYGLVASMLVAQEYMQFEFRATKTNILTVMQICIWLRKGRRRK